MPVNDAYNKVKQARDPKRICAQDVIDAMCEHFFECCGDRLSGNDEAVIGGIGLLKANASPVTIIGIQKGKNFKENVARHFGSAAPSGYRKAQRLMKQAEKFKRPIVTLIDTPGALCSPEAEEEGIGEAIASTLITMAQLTVPTLAIILGEGGSGGAIALALADQVWMLENSIYAILSPEGFAAILYKDAKQAANVAEMMKLTAQDLLELNVIDRIISESDEHGRLSNAILAQQIGITITETLTQLKQQLPHERSQQKLTRFRKF